jgi:two-component system catabolic regulation response regulator CreB
MIMAKGKILIVEDEISIFHSLEFVIKKENFEAVHVDSGNKAIEAFASEDYIAVILDIGLPDIDGFEVCRRIRKISPVPIIFLTARAEEIEKILGLELGADDYITKPFSPREVAARLKALLRRMERVSEQVDGTSENSTETWKLDNTKYQILFRGNNLNLSAHEFRLLSVLLKRPGRVFSRSELMDRAWEEPGMSLERTIDAHIKSIRSKIRQFDDSCDHIVTHRGFGYSLKE